MALDLDHLAEKIGEFEQSTKRSKMPHDSFVTCYLSLINSRKKTNIL